MRWLWIWYNHLQYLYPSEISKRILKPRHRVRRFCLFQSGNFQCECRCCEDTDFLVGDKGDIMAKGTRCVFALTYPPWIHVNSLVFPTLNIYKWFVSRNIHIRYTSNYIIIYDYIYTLVSLSLYIKLSLFIHTYLHTYIHTYIHIHTCLYGYIWYKHIWSAPPPRPTYLYIFVYIYINIADTISWV